MAVGFTNGIPLSTDGTLGGASPSTVIVPVQSAVKTYADTKIASTAIDIDSTMAADSDTRIPSQKAVKTRTAILANQGVANQGRFVGVLSDGSIGLLVLLLWQQIGAPDVDMGTGSIMSVATPVAAVTFGYP